MICIIVKLISSFSCKMGSHISRLSSIHAPQYFNLIFMRINPCKFVQKTRYSTFVESDFFYRVWHGQFILSWYSRLLKPSTTAWTVNDLVDIYSFFLVWSMYTLLLLTKMVYIVRRVLIGHVICMQLDGLHADYVTN